MYLSWLFINILVLLVIIIYAVKCIYHFKKHKLKSISYLVVTLGLLIISNFIKEQTPQEVFVLNTVSETVNTKALHTTKTVNLIAAFAFDVNLQITSLVSDVETIPLKGMSEAEGFSLGFDWQLENLTIQKNEDGTRAYTATGIVDWEILGIPLYAQTKEFTGLLNE